MNNLLDSTGLSLSEIAAQTGYSSPVSLSLAFRWATGMQPGAYRELRRG
ncbi:helix-turn-helix domain-containing protein [Victivallis vadensis]|mgnify:FL=1